MWQLSRPTPHDVRRHLDAQRGLAFTYAAVGATRHDAPPAGFARDHNRQRLGHGAAGFSAARDAIRAWAMFPAPLAWIAPPAIPIAEGEVAGVIVRAAGLWWLNAARIVYVIDEPRRFGFAYGTLPGHAERGEERFSVEWLADDTVWYDLLAFSQPRYWMARLAAPVVRGLQRRFARLSRAAMHAAAT
ncbi:MAG TPA: DUF1990 domain-containing protein [Kofleriaceae bacterium]|nr:DUF1990 domain-containing protein [Kofleriaceae bacterium]